MAISRQKPHLYISNSAKFINRLQKARKKRSASAATASKTSTGRRPPRAAARRRAKSCAAPSNGPTFCSGGARWCRPSRRTSRAAGSAVARSALMESAVSFSLFRRKYCLKRVLMFIADFSKKPQK